MKSCTLCKILNYKDTYKNIEYIRLKDIYGKEFTDRLIKQQFIWQQIKVDKAKCNNHTLFYAFYDNDGFIHGNKGSLAKVTYQNLKSYNVEIHKCDNESCNNLATYKCDDCHSVVCKHHKFMKRHVYVNNKLVAKKMCYKCCKSNTCMDCYGTLNKVYFYNNKLICNTCLHKQQQKFGKFKCHSCDNYFDKEKLISVNCTEHVANEDGPVSYVEECKYIGYYCQQCLKSIHDFNTLKLHEHNLYKCYCENIDFKRCYKGHTECENCYRSVNVKKLVKGKWQTSKIKTCSECIPLRPCSCIYISNDSSENFVNPEDRVYYILPKSKDKFTLHDCEQCYFNELN